MHKIVALISGLSFVLLASCTKYRCFDVKVDSICSTSANQKKAYVLLPGNKDGKINDLQFQEFAAYTDKALQAQGFKKASKIDDAEVAILLCYGISDPKYYEYTYSVPVWGQTGIASSKSSGTVNRFGNSVSFSENTSYTPSYGIVGSSTRVSAGVAFARYLVVSGIDLEQFKKSGKIEDAQELWSTKANSVGESGDLREIFPVLLIASQKHIAGNTGKQISYSIKEDKKLSERLKTLKG